MQFSWKGKLFHSFGPATAKHLSSISIVAVCSSHDARLWCGRTQLTTAFVGDQLAVGGQIGCSDAGQWQVDEGGHLEILPTSNRMPLQLLQHWRDVVVTSSGRHQTRSRILDRLQPAHETFGDAVKQWVAVVQATGNERLDQRLYGLLWYRSDERSELPQLVISTATHGGHLCRQRQLTVDYNSKVMRRLRHWYVSTSLALLRCWLWPAAGENPIT